MSKKHIIALANNIKNHNRLVGDHYSRFQYQHIRALAEFCKEQNPRFNAHRWMSYIAGECGPNGGKVKVST